MDAFSEEVERLAKEKDRKQDIIPPIQISLINKVLELKKCIVIPMLGLIDEFDTSAPFIKHSFWKEECEIRALLSMKRANKNIQKLGQYEDKSYCFDLPINENCTEKYGEILGHDILTDDDYLTCVEIQYYLEGRTPGYMLATKSVYTFSIAYYIDRTYGREKMIQLYLCPSHAKAIIGVSIDQVVDDWGNIIQRNYRYSMAWII